MSKTARSSAKSKNAVAKALVASASLGKVATRKNTLKKTSSLGSASLRTETGQYLVRTPQTVEEKAAIRLISTSPGLTARQYTIRMIKAAGGDITDAREIARIGRMINRLLATTSEGFGLAQNGLVSLSYMGPFPRWYRQLPSTSKALVKRDNPLAQRARRTLAIGSSIRPDISAPYIALRNNYLVSGAGLGNRYISAALEAQIEAADIRLQAQIEEDNARVIAVETYAVQVTETQAKLNESETKLDRILSSVQATYADTRHANAVATLASTRTADVIAQMQGQIARLEARISAN
jgi:hypothetical protein